MKQLKIIIEKHADGYVAYPVGVKGVVVGEGDTGATHVIGSNAGFHRRLRKLGALGQREGTKK